MANRKLAAVSVPRRVGVGLRAHPAHILLEKHLKELGLAFVKEVRFDKRRRWKFDYVVQYEIKYVPCRKIAIEIEGGLYAGGRHSRGKGYEADLNKYNEAAMQGWTVLRWSTGQVLRGEARDWLEEHLDAGE